LEFLFSVYLALIGILFYTSQYQTYFYSIPIWSFKPIILIYLVSWPLLIFVRRDATLDKGIFFSFIVKEFLLPTFHSCPILLVEAHLFCGQGAIEWHSYLFIICSSVGIVIVSAGGQLSHYDAILFIHSVIIY
jgi:hypothetical protein